VSRLAARKSISAAVVGLTSRIMEKALDRLLRDLRVEKA
jgi:hypothetical protein